MSEAREHRRWRGMPMRRRNELGNRRRLELLLLLLLMSM
jgi:hypothetical protein